MNKKYSLLALTSLLITGILSLFASASPDGLEKVAEEKGFIAKALEYPLTVFMPDYALSGTSNEYLATALAGVLGTIIVFLFVYFLVRGLSRY